MSLVSFFKPAKANCYCALCRTPRWIVRRRHIGFAGIVASGCAATAFMLVIWQKFDPRVSVVFALFLAFGEAFGQLRWRMGIVCKVCGFDPVLYMKDPAKVVARVKDRLDERKKDPAAMLSRPLNLPSISSGRSEELKALEERRQKPVGKMLSKSI